MGIVKGHGGFILVSSQLGRGATFAVYLPAATGSAEVAVGPPLTAFAGTGEMVLFVDDEPTVREAALAVLSRLGLTAIMAVDGADALVKAAQHRTHLRAVITDLHMPNVDGLAFARTLRGLLPDVTVIASSGRFDADSAEAFAALGVKWMLEKPFTQDQLTVVLGAALGLSTPSRPDQDA